jgi:Predicted ATP-binding protein involved in virulence
MELLYLWINKSKPDVILQQEFNFSPLHKFNVDNLKSPRNISHESIDAINLLTSDDEGNINNITAVVGSNGAGKTTLLSYIANNNCYSKIDNRDGYSRHDAEQYEYTKSIYVFLENNTFLLYYNLEEKLTCNFNILPENIYWNGCNEDNRNLKTEKLWNVRKQLLVYISNSSFIPESLLGYSRSDKTYNVNLHQRSMYIVADRFYMTLFGKNVDLDNIKKEDDGFAWIIKEQRNDNTFQELLDVLYYQYLIENNINENDFAGNFKERVFIDFDNIINLIETIFHNDFETIKEFDKGYYKFSKQQPESDSFESSRKYYNKIREFEKKINFRNLEEARRKNPTIVLYINLLFEMFFYEDNFVLSDIDSKEDIFKQLRGLTLSEKYQEYYSDIKKIDDILCEVRMNENLIDNEDDLACKYVKVVCKENKNFYKFFSQLFCENRSYILRYIRIRNLEMSSGERAMQNFFSWLVLLPQIDKIMNVNRNDYESKLLLIDEIDLYSHPEWQRKILKQLIETLNKIEKEKPMQVILTSHSPLILSDFPRENIIYMNKHNGKTVVEDNNKHKQTFGANIYTLIEDTFFLENGAVGEFARTKIHEVYEHLESNHSRDNTKRIEYQQIINMIGNNIVKREMQRIYDKKFGTSFQQIGKGKARNIEEKERSPFVETNYENEVKVNITNDVEVKENTEVQNKNKQGESNESQSIMQKNPDNNEELKNLKTQLENTLNAIDKILRGD